MGVCCGKDYNKTMFVPGNPILQSEIHEDTNLQCNIYQGITKFYQFTRVCGHGQFGTVREAYKKQNQQKASASNSFQFSKSNKKYAVKSILKSRIAHSFHRLKKEINTLRTTDHPNIVKLYDVYEDSQYIHIVMELCTGPDLQTYVYENGPIPENKLVVLMYKLISAISYLHNLNICHRDIKPENIMFCTDQEDSEFKLVDFGMSAKYAEGSMLSAVGTPYFIAPEVISRRYGKQCDIWSLGVTIYYLISLNYPFKGNNLKELMNNIVQGIFEFIALPELPHVWDQTSSFCKDLIRQMLTVDPACRIPIKRAIQHPWFRSSKRIKKSEDMHMTQDLVRNLKRYQDFGRVQKEVIKILVQNLEQEQIVSLANLFFALDKSKTGVITVKQLIKGLQAPSLLLSEQEVKEIVQSLRQMDKRMIKYSEFLGMVYDAKVLLEEENLWIAFKHFDEDNDNQISLTDFSRVLQKAQCHTEQQDIDEIMREFELVGQDKLDFDKFKQIMSCLVKDASSQPSSVNPSTLNSPMTVHRFVRERVGTLGSPMQRDSRSNTIKYLNMRAELGTISPDSNQISSLLEPGAEDYDFGDFANAAQHKDSTDSESAIK